MGRENATTPPEEQSGGSRPRTTAPGGGRVADGAQCRTSGRDQSGGRRTWGRPSAPDRRPVTEARRGGVGDPRGALCRAAASAEPEPPQSDEARPRAGARDRPPESGGAASPARAPLPPRPSEAFPLMWSFFLLPVLFFCSFSTMAYEQNVKFPYLFTWCSELLNRLFDKKIVPEWTIFEGFCGVLG